MSQESPFAELPPPPTQFRLLQLFGLTTLVALIAALAAPWVRQFSTDGQFCMSIGFIGGLLGVVSSVSTTRRLYKHYMDKHQDSHYVLKQTHVVSRLVLQLLLVGWIVAGFGAFPESLPSGSPRWVSYLLAGQFGYVVGHMLVSTFYYSSSMVILEEEHWFIKCLRIPWPYLRGVFAVPYRPNVLRLHRLDGDVYVWVPRARRNEVLSLLEEKTGLALEELRAEI